MFRKSVFKKIILILLVLFFFSSFKCYADLNSLKNKWLVKIGNDTYTVKDFLWWWNHWKTPGQNFLNSLDPYIQWLIFLKEAKKMQLSNSPFYQRRVLIYRKVRDILELQYEEVEKKIHITDKDLKIFYESKFKPLYHLKNFYFKTLKEAKNFRKKIRNLKDCERYFKKENLWKGDIWVRPWSTPETARKALFSTYLKKGDVLGPIKWNRMWAVVCVVEYKKGGKKDFEKIKEALKRIYKKELEAKLTDDLIKRLKKKYKIIFNKDVYDKVGLAPLPKKIKNKIVLKIANRILTAEDFHRMLLREARFRFAMFNPKDKKSFEEFKKFTLNSIIAQNLVEIEALNRGYENKEPLKSDLKFYKENLLVKGYLGMMLKPKIKITEKEIEKFAKTHPKYLGISWRVTLVYLEVSQKSIIDEIKEKLKKGKTLEEILKNMGFSNYRITTDISNFPPQLMARILEAPINKVLFFKLGKYYCVIKVLKRRRVAHKLTPDAKWQIRQILFRKKFFELEKELYHKLLKYYKVEVNKKVWEELKKEMSKNENI